MSSSPSWPARLSSLGTAALAAVFVLCGGSVAAASSSTESYQYLAPVPGARLVSPWNNIIIRQGDEIDRATLRSGRLSVVGSLSGAHTGELVLKRDAKTMIFEPDVPFALGETVEVRLSSGPRTRSGVRLPELAYSFSVSTIDPKRQPRRGIDHLIPEQERTSPLPSSDVGGVDRSTFALPCDTLPTGYPTINILGSDAPAAGNVFITPFGFGAPGPMIIMDNLGNPIFYRKLAGGKNAIDFRRQPSGMLTYFSAGAIGGSGVDPNDHYYGMDSTYAVVDSFFMGNGYITDFHDLIVLANGNALMMAYDPQPIGMDTVVVGGNPDAIVDGLIIQEIDASKSVVFQWRSWDYFPITDMIEEGRALTDSLIDYVHGNALDQDLDGNIVFSSRHLNEITKISRTTGDIIWRWGLNAKNNDFTFIGDTRGFSHQHHIRVLPNGNYTLFDNGNALVPQYSRAVEYELNESAMTATQVWEYRNTPDTFGGFMGSAQRLPDGGTMIGWGGTFAPPAMTEVHADDSEALEISLAPGNFSYRTLRFEWQTTRFETDVESLDFGVVALGDTGSLPLTITNNSGDPLSITCVTGSEEAFLVLDAMPIVIPAGNTAVVNVLFAPTHANPISGTLYVRSVEGEELIAQTVAVTGEGTGLLPAASDWGLLVMMLLVSLAGTVYLIRQRTVEQRVA